MKYASNVCSYAAGGLSHRSACKVAFFRGLCANELIASNPADGAMMAVGLSSEKVQPYISLLCKEFAEPEITVACINSPKNVTLSGNSVQIQRLEALLQADSIFVRKLQVSVAYHSPYMKQIASRYLSLMSHLEGGEQSDQHPTMFSSVTGSQISFDDLRTGEYWVQNLVNPVRFSDALTRVFASPNLRSKLPGLAPKSLVNSIVEIGPSGALKRPIQDTLKEIQVQKVSYISILDRAISADVALLNAIGNLYCLGFRVNISQINQENTAFGYEPMALPDLPEYPFDHSRKYWYETSMNREGYRLRKSPKHSLVGAPALGWHHLGARWTNTIRALDQMWIQDHQVSCLIPDLKAFLMLEQVDGTIIYPAAGMIVMAIEACKQLADPSRLVNKYLVKDVDFLRALVIPPGPNGIGTEFDLRPSRASVSKNTTSWDFRLCMEANGAWQEVCHGLVQVEYAVSGGQVDGGKEAQSVKALERLAISEADHACGKKISQEQFYNYFEALGFKYGPAFQGVQQAGYDGFNTASAKLNVYQWPELEHPQSHTIHPATLDAILQVGIVNLSNGVEKKVPPVIPSRLGKLWIEETGIQFPATRSITVCGHGSFTSHRKAESSCLVSNDEDQEILMGIEAFEGTAINREDISVEPQAKKSLCYNMLWKPDMDHLDSSMLEKYCGTSEVHQLGAEFFSDLVYAILAFISETVDALASTALDATPPHLLKYIGWMERELSKFRQGLLPSFTEDSSKWKKLTTDHEFREELHARLESSMQGLFYLKVGRNLLSILKGELDPLELLFQDGLVGKFYSEINEQVISYKPLLRYLDLLMHKHPDMQILEIGAGTGASTDYILRALTADSDDNTPLLKCNRYDYTDISPVFLEAARDKYSQFGQKVKYFVLDISSDPLEQGLQPGSYDVIIAASVLHATQNLGTTLRNVRKLLRTGGKLILFEIVYDAVRTSFAFGLLNGWWLSDEENRGQSPWVTCSTWDSLMRDSGFSGVDLEIKDFQEDSCHEYSILISTAVEITPSPVELDITLPAPVIITYASYLHLKLANEVREALISRKYTQPPIIMSMQAALATLSMKQRTFIVLQELDQSFLANLNSGSFRDLQQMVTKGSRILWVTSGGGDGGSDPRKHIVDGLARTSCTESNKQIFVTLALQDLEGNSCNAVENILEVFHETNKCSVDDFEPEYMEKDRILHIGRVNPWSFMDTKVQDNLTESRDVVQEFDKCPPLRLAVGVPGLLDTLKFVEDPRVDEPLAPGELEIKVAYAGMNFRDCLTVLGQVDTDFIGCECAGIVSRTGEACAFKPGDRITGLFIDSYSTYARGHDTCAVKIPDVVSLAEAGGALAVFTTAWYALHEIAQVMPRESVLVHAGAGGTGQAVIQVAKFLGAEVYATVGTDEKKNFLVETYGINAENIFYSRDTSFAAGVLRRTGGRGVDVVLNSLSGEHLVASWECLAPVSTHMLYLYAPFLTQLDSAAVLWRSESAILLLAANCLCGSSGKVAPFRLLISSL